MTEPNKPIISALFGPIRRNPTRSSGLVSIALGVAVLVGWETGLEILTRVAPGLISMKPNAALGFLLAGSALWALGRDRRSPRVAIGLAVAVMAVGGLTLVEYAYGIDLGIDEILAREPPESAIGSLSPGRMHPTSAFSFVLIGLAVALLATDKSPGVAQVLAILAGLIAASALIGYLYGERLFIGVASFNRMALATTVGFLVLAAGVLLARPDRGLMAAITSDTAGGMLARWLLPFAIFVPITLHGMTMWFQRNGVFDEHFGGAVRVVCGVAVFFVVISQAAQMLHRIDLERRGISEGLRSAVAELEQRVRIQAKVEADLRASEQRYRFLADAMPQIVWTSGPNGEADYFNLRSQEYSGRSFEHFLGFGWKDAIHPADQARTFARWLRSIRTGDPFETEFRIRREVDGSYRWHLGRAVAMRDDSGAIVLWIGTCTDIDEQRRTQEELKLAQEWLEQRVNERTVELAVVVEELRRGELRYRSLVEATSAIVWHTPASGAFETEQPGWSAFTGQPFDRLKGWGWLEVIHPDDRHATALAWSAAVESRSLYQVTHRVLRHDGEYRYMSVRAIPIMLADGSIEQWLGVHTDVDDQARVQEAMRRAREAAEASTRAKSEFLANMSHEIRTPMNGILGMTELALDTDLSPPQREYLGLVKSSAEALLTVINDILDFSKIEAGKLDLDPMPFRLRDCVEETLKTLALRAHTKGLEISGRIAPAVPDGLVGDSGRLRQILVNLVGNAIKFTDRGEVAVSVECEAADDDGVTLHLAVKDTGIGIPIAKQEAIFEPFEQADGSTTRTHGGTGLGLAISARLVALMGGRIWVESEPGCGSTFHFTAKLDLQPCVPQSQGECDPETLRNLPVLVVDDNRTNRRILEELLANWGASPTSVDGGPNALDAMRVALDEGRPFRVVLLDGMMPGMDGNEVADRIAADSGLASAIVILLTSNDMAVGGPRRRSKRIAASLTKPIRQSELFDVLMSLLSAGSPREIVPTRVESAGPSPPGRSYAILLAEDNVVNQRVVTIMLEKRGHRVTVACDGRRALEALDRDWFDLVLMDVQMPEMDGFEAVAAIRRGEADRRGSRRQPVIALTAHAMLGDRERCLAAGFDAYVPKPIRAESLISAMDEVLALVPCGPPAPVAIEAPAAFDREAAMECTGGDEALFDEVLQIFLEDCPRLLDQIDSAIDAGDCAGLQRSAHTIRGAAGHFAASAVVSSAQRLEVAAKSGRLGEARACRSALVAALDDFFRALGDLAPEVAPWHRFPVSTLESQP